jgi:hypothetical protein
VDRNRAKLDAAQAYESLLQGMTRLEKERWTTPFLHFWYQREVAKQTLLLHNLLVSL